MDFVQIRTHRTKKEDEKASLNGSRRLMDWKEFIGFIKAGLVK